MSDEWMTATLGEVAEIRGGGTPSTKEPSYWSGDVIWLTPTEVVKSDGEWIDNSERTITYQGLENSSAKLLPAGAVLLTTRASVGYTALARVPLATNQGFQSLIPGDGLLSEFLMYWIQGNRIEFTSRAGGSTFPEISKKKVAGIPIVVPPLAVQRRIVDLIAHLDTHLTNLRIERVCLRSARDAALRDTLTGKREVMEAQMSGEWVRTTLGEVTDIRGGGTPSTKEPSYWGGDVVWLTPTEVVKSDGQWVAASERMISRRGLENSSAKLLPARTVLLTTRASVGYVALAQVPLTTNQGFQSLISSDELLPEFLMYWIQGNRHEFTSRAGGSTFPEISKTKVASIPIVLPPLAVQERIVDLISDLDSDLVALSNEVDALQALRSGLVGGLLAGHVEIPVTYDSLLAEVS